MDHTLSPAAVICYAWLCAAAAHIDSEHTPPLDFYTDMAPSLRLSRYQVRNALHQLRLAKHICWTRDEGDRYVVHVQNPKNKNSDIFDFRTHVVDVVDSDINQKEMIPQQQQQQQHESEILDGEEGLTVRMCLKRAGVWSDKAGRIEAQIIENVRRGYNHLPDLTDVLGWIAFSFAYQRENKVINPAGIVSANLSSNRRCPDRLRPPYICTNCRREEAHCECLEPDLRLPTEFLEFAFVEAYDPDLESFWGVCRRCHAFPCQCGDEAGRRSGDRRAALPGMDEAEEDEECGEEEAVEEELDEPNGWYEETR